ncbi:hypothetical protein AKJ16_DCAP06051 [Drosera capensis]
MKITAFLGFGFSRCRRRIQLLHFNNGRLKVRFLNPRIETSVFLAYPDEETCQNLILMQLRCFICTVILIQVH